MKLNVLLVDDSHFTQEVIRKMLSKKPEIGEVLLASTGEQAREIVKKQSPQIILLDLVLGDCNGLSLIKEFREKYDIPVIVLTSLTRKGAYISLEALEEGAFDVIGKPENQIDLSNLDKVLIERIREAVYYPSFTELPEIKCALIASSTGGPQALSWILSRLNNTLNFPLVIVQHIPSAFIKPFAERLNRKTPLLVKEAEDQELLKPGYVYLAPPLYQLGFFKDRSRYFINLFKDKTYSFAPSADFTFTSAAEIFGADCLAVVLTGIGSDGAAGLLKLRKKGALTVAQAPQECVVFGMPRACLENKSAAHVMFLKDIVEVLQNGGVKKK